MSATTTGRVLADAEREMSTLGAVLISDRVLSALLLDEGLRPEHFYGERHREVFRAMVALYDRGEGVDVGTVTSELDRTRAERVERGGPELDDPAAVDALAGAVPSVANARSYAKRVRELALLRQKQKGAWLILEAADREDWDALADAEGELSVPAVESRTKGPKQLAEEVLEFLQSDGGERWALPWDRLTRALAGGLRRGTVTVIGGHSSHGKSAASDDLLETAALRNDLRAHVYINEMTDQERVLRFVARRTGIDLGRLMQPDKADLTSDEWSAILSASSEIPWGVTDAAGWTAEEIARHMRQHRWDVCCVDIFQLIETGRGETRDLDRASRILNAAAKQANCALILTTHLNEARSQTVRPEPVLGDIRGTGQLKNDADNVLFVHREQTDDGSEVLDSGVVVVAKARMGIQGVRQPVRFDGRHMRFLAVDPADFTPTSESDTTNGGTPF